MNREIKNKCKIAVTACGGGAGQSILKSLQDTEYEVIALDGEALGAGLYSTNKCYVIPYANHKNYINRLLEICKKEEITLVSMDIVEKYLLKPEEEEEEKEEEQELTQEVEKQTPEEVPAVTTPEIPKEETPEFKG